MHQLSIFLSPTYNDCIALHGNISTADVIFGGSADPCALGNLYSIVAISMKSNGAIHNAVSDLLEPYGVDASRMYINFFDMERANVGWNRKTFAG
jgi:Macrophage migration inhibitory factor (MIF).